MARKPRIHYPGAVYHVILRGNGGQDIFYSVEESDTVFISCFRKVLKDEDQELADKLGIIENELAEISKYQA